MTSLSFQDLQDAYIKMKRELDALGPEMVYVIVTASQKYISIQSVAPSFPNMTPQELKNALNNYVTDDGETLAGSKVFSFPKPGFIFSQPMSFDWAEEQPTPLPPREENDKVSE